MTLKMTRGKLPIYAFERDRKTFNPLYNSIHKAPPKLYHEVLVPGLLDLCKRLNVTILPDTYERTEDGCTLEGIMKWK